MTVIERRACCSSRSSSVSPEQRFNEKSSNKNSHRCKLVLYGLKYESYFIVGRHLVKSPHRNRHEQDPIGSVAEDIGGRYSSQLPVVVEGGSDVINPENTGPGTALNIQTADRQAN